MAKSGALTIAMLAVAVSHALAMDIPESEFLQMRNLKQQACDPNSCVLPTDLGPWPCSTSDTLYCLAGAAPSGGYNAFDLASCRPGGTAYSCRLPAPTVPCPAHLTSQQVTICYQGFTAGGAVSPSCKSCRTYTVFGTCDQYVGGVVVKSSRSKVTCPTTPIPYTGSPIFVTNLGCTSSNGMPGVTGGALYFGTIGDVTLKQIPASSLFLSNSCSYTVGAAPSNNCLSKTLASQAVVVVGNGPLTTVGCPDPIPT